MAQKQIEVLVLLALLGLAAILFGTAFCANSSAHPFTRTHSRMGA